MPTLPPPKGASVPLASQAHLKSKPPQEKSTTPRTRKKGKTEKARKPNPKKKFSQCERPNLTTYPDA